MSDTFSIADWLLEQFNKKHTNNKSYSMRAFARDLSISSGSLSELLSNKRLLTSRQALSFSKSLNLSDTEMMILKKLVNSRCKKSQGPYHKIQADDLKYMVHWKFRALLSLFECIHFKNDINWMANKLSLSNDEIKEAINILIEKKLIIKKNEKFLINTTHTTSSEDIQSDALKRSHQLTIKKALQDFTHIPVDQRDLSSIIFAVDKSKLSAAKMMIRKFRREFSQFLEAGKKSEVYLLNYSIFTNNKKYQ